MTKKMPATQLFDEEDHEQFFPIKRRRFEKNSIQSSHRSSSVNKLQNKNLSTQEAQSEEPGEFFSYQASRFEAGWLMDSLAEFQQTHWITDVHHMVKGGKEASVYLCNSTLQEETSWLAAKVYRPRRFRNLRNDGIYREGRDNLDEHGNVIVNAGMLYAMKKKTAYGQHLLHQSWIKHEYNTMQILHKAGCDVPKPLASGANCILMDYLGDLQTGAPTLHEVSLTPIEARELGQRVLFNMECMLKNQRIHGDLSPFNILIWQKKIYIIDFPQALHPNQNPQTYPIFLRDLQKMDVYFTSFGFSFHWEKIGPELWQKYRYFQSEDFVYDIPDQLDEDDQ